MKLPQLIAITRPTIGDNMSAEEFIAYCARVSNPSNQMNTETAPKLILYLIKNGHWSPFDMVDMVIEVTTSKAIAIQMIRHSSLRFQEFSQRYSEVLELDGSHIEMRKKHIGGNRQGSGDIDEQATRFAKESFRIDIDSYSTLLENEIAPESARMILPMATLTKLYVKGSVRSWITYFWQRLDTHAQKEHRQLAFAIFDIFQKEFPVIAELVKNYKPSVVKNENWLTFDI